MSVYVGVVVGVSLLRNAVDRGVVRDAIVVRALGGDVVADRELGRLGLGSSLSKSLLGFACGDVEGCCAELSTIAGLRRLVDGVFRVELFYTDTKASWLCAMTIAECLNRGVLPNVEVVGSVQVPLFGGGDVEGGLVSFVNVVGRRLFSAVSSGLDAYIVVTGGAKVEAILASMVAWLVGARPVYRVEGGPVVILPRLPITLDREFVSGLCELARGGSVSDELVREFVRLGFVVERGGRYVVPRWVVELLRVRGLC